MYGNLRLFLVYVTWFNLVKRDKIVNHIQHWLAELRIMLIHKIFDECGELLPLFTR